MGAEATPEEGQDDREICFQTDEAAVEPLQSLVDGEELEGFVATAFTGPAQNFLSVFKLIFKLVRKQQLTIGSLREELYVIKHGTESDARRLDALESQVSQLSQDVVSHTAKEEATMLEQVPPAAATTGKYEQTSDVDAETCLIVHDRHPAVVSNGETLDFLGNDRPAEVLSLSSPQWSTSLKVMRFKNRMVAAIAKRKLDEAAAIYEYDGEDVASAAISMGKAGENGTEPTTYKIDEAPAVKELLLAPTPAPASLSVPSKSLRSLMSPRTHALARMFATTELVSEMDGGEHESTLLVRHVRNQQARRALVELLRILDPVDEPTQLNRWGFCKLAFSNKVNTLAAKSVVDGLELEGCKLEATKLMSASQEMYLACELDALEESSRKALQDNRRSAVMLTSVPIDATESDLQRLFPEALSCELARSHAAHGAFAMGRLTFADVSAATEAAASLSTGEKRFTRSTIANGASELCLGAIAVEEPATEVLARRIAELERAVNDADRKSVELSSVATKERAELEARQTSVESALGSMHDRIQLVWNQMSDIEAVKEGGRELDARLSSRIDVLETERERERLSIENQLHAAAHFAGNYVLSELEKLHILIPAADSASSYVASSELFAAAALRECLEAQLSRLDRLDSLSTGWVSYEALGQACAEAAADKDGSMFTGLVRQLRGEITAKCKKKADCVDVDRRCRGVVDGFKAKLDAAIMVERESLGERFTTLLYHIDNLTYSHGESDKVLQALSEKHRALAKRVNCDNMAVQAGSIALSARLDDIKAALQCLERSAVSTTVPSEFVNQRHLEHAIASLADRLDADFTRRAVSRETFDRLRRDLDAKTDQHDVLKLIAMRMTAADRKLPSDNLMIGVLNYRCLGCNRPACGLHDKPADKVVHAGLSPVPSTVAFNAAQPHDDHTPRSATNKDRRSQTSYPHTAAYSSSGRLGALRPLHRQTSPGIPIPNPFATYVQTETGSRIKAG